MPESTLAADACSQCACVCALYVDEANKSLPTHDLAKKYGLTCSRTKAATICSEIAMPYPMIRMPAEQNRQINKPKHHDVLRHAETTRGDMNLSKPCVWTTARMQTCSKYTPMTRRPRDKLTCLREAAADGAVAGRGKPSFRIVAQLWLHHRHGVHGVQRQGSGCTASAAPSGILEHKDNIACSAKSICKAAPQT